MTKQNDSLLVDVIGKAIQVPGVKVNRDEFLVKTFGKISNEKRNLLIEKGPVEAGFSQRELKQITKKLINDRTLTTSGISFAAGLPGGLAMAGTIPADTIQFYGFALRMAQEIAYIYGAEDLWKGNEVDMEQVTNQLVLYCGVMFGISGSAATLKLMSSALAKQIANKLPQKALTKTIYYPIIKKIAMAFGVKMTKDVFAKGVSKVVPVVGGVISGGMTLATMRPMGMRLMESFDEAKFDYTQEDYESDFEEVMDIVEADIEIVENEEIEVVEVEPEETVTTGFASKIKEAKSLLEDGFISQDEFEQIKQKIIANM